MKYKGQPGGNAMVPHMSGTTLDAQARYAAGVRRILERHFKNEEQEPSDVIVINGGYATKYILKVTSDDLGRMVNVTRNKFVEEYILVQVIVSLALHSPKSEFPFDGSTII